MIERECTMPRCPFCKEFSYGEMGWYTCNCGETVPDRVHDYRRERCLCGRTMGFPPVEEFIETGPAFPPHPGTF